MFLKSLTFVGPNKSGILFKVQIALLSFGFGLVETRVRSGGVYLEEFEPAEILITIDGR